MRDSLSNAQRLRRNILRVYLAVALLMIVLVGISLRQAWNNHITTTNALLIRNASSVSTLFQTTAIDVTKVLQTAQIKLEQRLHNNTLDQKIASNILYDVSKDFMFYRTSNLFGLLFSTDTEGEIYGKSGPSIRDGLNISDRYYFESLKNNPNQQFSIGNLVETRTTGKNAFHVAISLLDKQGHFAGIVAQQILEQDLSEALEGVMNHGKAQTYTYAVNKQMAFVYPSAVLNDKNLLINHELLLKVIDEEDSTRGSLKITGDQIGRVNNFYAGYAWSPQLQIYTISILPESSVLYDFARNNLWTAIVGLFSFLIATILFVVLYFQSKQMGVSQFESTHDSLTGLNNRRSLDEEFERLCRESMRMKQPISVLFMDIDHFKVVNDAYGHEVGDRVLKAVATSIKSTLKRPLDVCCRWGGEEFVAILPHTDEQGALKIANDIMAAIHRLKITEGEIALEPVTISIGIKSATINADNVHDDLIDMADKAMFKAKLDGRDRVVVYRAGIHH